MTDADHSDSTELVIEASGLTKVFAAWTRSGRFRRSRSTVEAVRGIDLTVGRGEMVGYIGPNGAGKSTTIKMLTGVLAPTAGTARVLGREPLRERVALARRIGVVFGQRTQLWWDLPLRDSFELLGAVYRVPDDAYRRNRDLVVDLLDLGPQLDRPVRQLSLGQRMRAELAGALLHDPELVFLDEPTIGLDVVSKHEVRRFLAELNRTRGTTVLLTTHDLSDIEQLCRRIVIIDHGRVAHDGPLDEFRARHGTHRTLVADLERPELGADVVDRLPRAVPGVEGVELSAGQVRVRFDRRVSSASTVIAALAAITPVRDLSVVEPDIEDMVHRLYRGATERPDPEDRPG